MDDAQRITVLLDEYKRLTQDKRMYIQLYTSKLTIFSALIFSGFTLAYKSSEYRVLFPIIPILILLIAFYTVGESLLIALLSLRIRRIEDQIRILNQGERLLEWETEYCKYLVTLLITFPGSKTRRPFKAVNPIMATVVIILAAFGFVIVACFLQLPAILGTVAAIAYCTLIVAMFLLLLHECTLWFRVGQTE